MAKITEGRGRRNAKLASLPLGMAGRAVAGGAKRLAGKDKDEVQAELLEKTAQQLFSVLGELKGGAMKIGQALSIYEAAIPEEFGEPFREALTKLQAEAPPMPAKKVHQVLDQQLGTKWRERFREFNDEAVASASIGQVHKGVWSDGREVAIKVQYPGADHALRADLKTLSRLSGVLQKLSPGTDVKTMMDELIARTEDELDYVSEANYQRQFAKAFDGDPDFCVPKIVASAPKVVVSEWVTGTPLSKIISEGTQEQRDNAAFKMALFEYSSPARCGLLHGDPHPGNFQLLEDGRFAVLDFGAVGLYPDGLPEYIGKVFRLARDDDYDALRDELVASNFIQPGFEDRVSTEDLVAFFAPYVDPLKVDSFHFTRRWLQKITYASTDVNGDVYKTSRYLNTPKEYVMALRVMAGCAGIAAQLDATVHYQDIMREWIPGYADE
ncbi:ABC1 kinase family protein [Jongsikchunia kroppenstedtii]|uniref:ABC1 kinase family protein n=1 Tax=Jongsikchunia kroppenstedtii TaxID=1121721 RepID=UPI000376C002|nr:AarF/UbiB family protein [Jongsikchunia kroppenstedtii]